jgi:translation initiation factor 2 beta subunit (eIF-2beta)/eIF-5
MFKTRNTNSTGNARSPSASTTSTTSIARRISPLRKGKHKIIKHAETYGKHIKRQYGTNEQYIKIHKNIQHTHGQNTEHIRKHIRKTYDKYMEHIQNTYGTNTNKNRKIRKTYKHL